MKNILMKYGKEEGLMCLVMISITTGNCIRIYGS